MSEQGTPGGVGSSDALGSTFARKCSRPKCSGDMLPGVAMWQTYTGMPDFPGREVVTVSPGGPEREDMGTKDMTHEAIAQALADDRPLTHEQRAVLLGLVADDKAWQREVDKLREVLNPVTMSRFLSDVSTAAGLLEYGKRDKGLARRMADRAWELRKQVLGPNTEAQRAA